MDVLSSIKIIWLDDFQIQEKKCVLFLLYKSNQLLNLRCTIKKNQYSDTWRMLKGAVKKELIKNNISWEDFEYKNEKINLGETGRHSKTFMNNFIDSDKSFLVKFEQFLKTHLFLYNNNENTFVNHVISEKDIGTVVKKLNQKIISEFNLFLQNNSKENISNFPEEILSLSKKKTVIKDSNILGFAELLLNSSWLTVEAFELKKKIKILMKQEIEIPLDMLNQAQDMNNRLHSLMIEDKSKETLNTNNVISLIETINEGCLFETKKFDLLTLKIVIGLGHITGIKLGILAPLEKKDIWVVNDQLFIRIKNKERIYSLTPLLKKVYDLIEKDLETFFLFSPRLDSYPVKKRWDYKHQVEIPAKIKKRSDFVYLNTRLLTSLNKNLTYDSIKNYILIKTLLLLDLNLASIQLSYSYSYLREFKKNFLFPADLFDSEF